MSDRTVRVHLPIRALARRANRSTRLFYRRLLNVLDELGIQYVLAVRENFDDPPPPATDGFIEILPHSLVERPGVWNVKMSYLRPFFYFDKSGYSGWSSLASRGEELASSRADLTVVEQFHADLVERFIRTNSSKYPQPRKGWNKRSQRYVFVAAQMPTDRTMRLSRVSLENVVNASARALASAGIDLLIKKHPRDSSTTVERIVEDAKQTYSHIHLVNSSVHDLIAESIAVITINSGVGFESLIHLKHVFTCGKSDYEAVTHRVTSIADLSRIVDVASQPVDGLRIKTFLYRFLREELIDVDDIGQLRRVVLQRIVGQADRTARG